MSGARATAAAARQRAMKQALAAKQAALRAKLKTRLQKRPGAPKKRDRRRWWLLLLLLVLLLWMFVHDCGGEAPAVPVPDGVSASGLAPVPPPVEIPEPPGHVARRDRPAYESEPPEALPWLAAFRMQVAARSPRLAACFLGADRPGRLKWTAAVEPVSGHVSDETLEPTLLSDDLTTEQRACVIGVLSDPPYRLPAEGARSTPSHVGLVIEF